MIVLAIIALLVCVIMFIRNVLISVRKDWCKFTSGLQFLALGMLVMLSILGLWLVYELYFNRLLSSDNLYTYAFEEAIGVWGLVGKCRFSVNELSLNFVLLISFLYPVIFILLQHDLNVEKYKYYSYMI